jgi:hypothetical protein
MFWWVWNVCAGWQPCCIHSWVTIIRVMNYNRWKRCSIFWCTLFSWVDQYLSLYHSHTAYDIIKMPFFCPLESCKPIINMDHCSTCKLIVAVWGWGTQVHQLKYVALNVFLKPKSSYVVRNIVAAVWYLQVNVQNVDVRKEKYLLWNDFTIISGNFFWVKWWLK